MAKKTNIKKTTKISPKKKVVSKRKFSKGMLEDELLLEKVRDDIKAREEALRKEMKDIRATLEFSIDSKPKKKVVNKATPKKKVAKKATPKKKVVKKATVKKPVAKKATPKKKVVKKTTVKKPVAKKATPKKKVVKKVTPKKKVVKKTVVKKTSPKKKVVKKTIVKKTVVKKTTPKKKVVAKKKVTTKKTTVKKSVVKKAITSKPKVVVIKHPEISSKTDIIKSVKKSKKEKKPLPKKVKSPKPLKVKKVEHNKKKFKNQTNPKSLRLKPKLHEQSVMLKANLYAFFSLTIITSIIIGFILIFRTTSWDTTFKLNLGKFTESSGLTITHPTLKGALMFDADNYLIGLFFWSSIILIILASLIQPIWTFNISSSTNVRSILIFLGFSTLVGLSAAMFGLSIGFQYIYIIPMIITGQYLFKVFASFISTNADYYKYYLWADLLFILTITLGLVLHYFYGYKVPVQWLYLGIPLSILYTIYGIFKYKAITKTIEWAALLKNHEQYGEQISEWFAFRLISDWISWPWHWILFKTNIR